MAQNINCKVWITKETPTFPEVQEGSPLKENLLDRPNVGVAFSGGGTRSASAVLGQLRALNELGLISKIRYISCVSGGSWAAVPFTYLPEKRKKKKPITDAEFLGEVVEPGDLTLSKLKEKAPSKMALRRAIAKSLILVKIALQRLLEAGHKTYSRAIGEIFLKPFKLGDYRRFFSSGPESISAILDRNSGLKKGDFYPTRQDRPFLIAGGTILRLENPDPTKKIHFEMTPLYAGARVLFEGAGVNGWDIGGGYVEPFGFDTEAPDDPPDSNNIVSVLKPEKMKGRFALSDVVGTSGAAPAEFVAKHFEDIPIFPEFRHWPLAEIGTTPTAKYLFGDGGLLENLGIMPLLMRKVEKIVVFVNTKRKLTGGGKGQINGSVRALFMETEKSKFNRVFPRAKYNALVDGLLDAKKAGKTVMFQDKYKVLENLHYGIEKDWEVEVLWVYNERVDDWNNLLPNETQQKIGKKGIFKRFPHYKTFFENAPEIMDLKRQQVSLLAHLSCWNIMSNKEIFKKMLS